MLKVGDTIGELVILDLKVPYESKSGKKINKAKVKCSCGKEFSVFKNSLTKNNPQKSCKSCSGIIDLTGLQVGELTVVGKDSERYVSPSSVKNKSNRSEIKWICKCSCGKETSVLGTHLRNRTTNRCWQCKIEKQKCNGRLSSTQFARYKYSSKKRGLEFNLTKKYVQDIFKKQNGKCALTALPIVFANTIDGLKNGESTASLDRINSSKGYIKGNVQWVHKDINAMKGNLEEKLFKKYCKLICNY